MNESIASLSFVMILGILLLWGAAEITRLRHYRIKKGYFRVKPVGVSTLASGGKAEQALQMPERVPQPAAQQIDATLPYAQTEAEQEQPALTIELELASQDTKQDIKQRILRSRDLRGVSLRGQDLAGAALSHCNLVGADLSGADLQGAELANADLTNATLTGANLSGCNCTGARFHGANLAGANLRDSNLTDTRFGPTTRPWRELYRFQGEGRTLQGMAEIEGANLRDAALDGANCTGSDIVDANQYKNLYWTRW